MPNMGIYCCCRVGCCTGANNAIVSGLAAGCIDDAGTSLPLDTFTDGDDYCEWFWADASSQVNLIYAKNDVTATATPALGCTPISLLAGEWLILYGVNSLNVGAFGAWSQKTTGFSCSSATDKVSGTHAFTAGECAPTQGDCIGELPTITVSA